MLESYEVCQCFVLLLVCPPPCCVQGHFICSCIPTPSPITLSNPSVCTSLHLNNYCLGLTLLCPCIASLVISFVPSSLTLLLARTANPLIPASVMAPGHIQIISFIVFFAHATNRWWYFRLLCADTQLLPRTTTDACILYK